MADKVAPKKKGRKPILDPELVAAELMRLQGNITSVAAHFKVGRSAIQNLIKRRPSLQQVLADAREGMIDHAESALLVAVSKREAWAVCFTLKTLGKNRGYTERQELTGKDGGPIQTSTRYQEMTVEELEREIKRLEAIT